MMPGITVIPTDRMTFAAAGTVTWPSRPTAVMWFPSIKTTESSIGGPPYPSINRPPTIAIGPLDDCAGSAAGSHKARIAMPSREEAILTGRFIYLLQDNG